MTTSDEEPLTLESLKAAYDALEGDMNTFWLMFGACLVFCELLSDKSCFRIIYPCRSRSFRPFGRLRFGSDASVERRSRERVSQA